MMQNETIKSVDIFDDEIIFTTESGKRFKMYHYQDCCESVYLIDDYERVAKKLVGKKIERLDVVYDQPDDAANYDRCTITEFRFNVNGETEVIRWFGSSNGYYSETASIEEIK